MAAIDRDTWHLLYNAGALEVVMGTRCLALLCACIPLALGGCAGDGTGMGVPARTATPTATVTAEATASSTPTATLVDTATPTATTTPTTTPTSTPTSPPAGPTAVARRITAESELIGGALAHARVGDYLIANDRIRAIVRDVGREFSFIFTYGGNIIDADIVRPPGVPGRDNFGAMTPLVNLSLTVNVQEINVVNDGSNGEPAVLRTFGVDDLLDAIDPTNAIAQLGAGSVPASAMDRDIPVEVMTEYTLAPGERSIRIETTIFNNSDQELPLYVGDFVTPSGELDTFVPGLGFGDALLRPRLPYLAYPGVGSAAGVSYGILPRATASAFSQSGFTAYLIGQSVLNVLLSQQPGVFKVAAQGSASFSRYFTVGGGDVASISEENHRLAGDHVGVLRGTVTAGGVPAPRAQISLVQTPGRDGAPYNVIAAFLADENGSYEGSVAPGTYTAMAKLEGYPYEGGGSMPTEHTVVVSSGGQTTQDFNLPDTGRLQVEVANAAGDPLPAKVSIVGFDASPDPGNPTTIFILEVDAFVFGSPTKQRGTIPYGLAGVHFVGPTGSEELLIAPGEYEAVVSHGPEYSIHKEAVTITAGATTTINAVLERVVDTAGFVGADHHVHLLNSFDCGVTRDERILTMIAEGVDFFAATDHDFVTDLRADITRLGGDQLVATVAGAETTTFNLGHFNVWPLNLDPTSHIGGPPDWGRSGVAPGMDYPALGSYDLSPTELFALAPEGSVVQANHFNSETLGFFHLAGIDTAMDPPQSFSPPTRIRQDPSISNLYDDHLTALELWIDGSRDQGALFEAANLGDWFNLINQGRIKTGTANSDTHTTAIVQAGGPRSYVASAVDDPADLDPATLADSVNAGSIVGSNGPFVRISIEGDSGELAGLDVGLSHTVTATSTPTLHLNIQSPEWAEFDTIDIYANTQPVPVPESNFLGVEVPRYNVVPSMILTAGEEFEIERVVVNDAVPGAARLEANVDLPLPVDTDTWVVVVVKGTDGVSRPLWPMNPQDLDEESNPALDDLTDGNLGEGGALTLAFTNPLFIDADGDGEFEPPAP